jgi:hypothetical protein
VAEKRTIDVPRRIVRMERQQEVDFHPVGRVSPAGAAPPSSAASGLAARLRPLDPNTPVQPLQPAGSALPGSYSAPRIASSTVGRTSGTDYRSSNQSGMPATELNPGASGTLGTPLPPPGTGIATGPSIPFFR